MITSVHFIVLLFINFISKAENHVGQECNRIFRICLASNSYCDENNICRCDPHYPVNISLHSCKKGKKYSERCEYTEECSYFDPNSYCSQLPYRSICECHTGFLYNEIKTICEKVGDEVPKPSSVLFPTAIGLSLSFACVLCCCLAAWHYCKRQNLDNTIFSNSRISSHTHYLPTSVECQRPLPSAPTADESLPNYDTVLTLKVSEDTEPPPSYEEVIEHDQALKA